MPDDATSGPTVDADGQHPRGPLLNTEQAARLIMKHPERVRQLARAGWIAHTGEGRKGEQWHYRLLDVVQGYIRFRDDEDKRTAKSAAQSRITDARSREVELRNAQREGRLIELDEAVAAVEAIMGMLRQQLAGMPARVTRDLELRRTMETALHDILDHTADVATQRAQAMADRRAAGAAVAANGAGPMGGDEPDASADFGRARPA
jgi:phage terminase Nu1 subunit (DNA packaging protein)